MSTRARSRSRRRARQRRIGGWQRALRAARRLPGPVKVAGAVGTVGGAILVVLDLTGRLFGGGTVPTTTLDQVALLNPNTTRAAFVAQNPNAFPPRIGSSSTVGGVFLVSGSGDATHYTIRWSVIDGDTGQLDTRPGWSQQLGDDFAPRSHDFSRRVWVPVPAGMGSFRVLFDLRARGSDAVQSRTTDPIALSG